MYFKLNNFSGSAPAVDSRRLGEQFGQIAENLDFESGALDPITNNTDTLTLSNSNRKSIFFYNNTNWLQFNEEVDVVEGPVPNDSFNRLYWTGQDFPRVAVVVTLLHRFS